MAIALGIETSCDDCSVSLVKEDGEVLFLSQSGQNSIHEKFGGIVPELASRAQGEQILPLIEQALKTVPIKKIDLIAVTNRPGLLGSLLVGSMTAKILSWLWGKPLIGVNHIEAHIFSPALFLSGEKGEKISLPALALIVSGGHSSLFYVKDIGRSVLVAQTRDDSAGEALDKFARLLGLPWPGGAILDSLSQNVSKEKSFFSKIKTDDLSFSFSGLKSQGRRLIQGRSQSWVEKNKAQLSASYQERLVEHLMEKWVRAYKKYPLGQALLGGGVSANSLLRHRLREWSQKNSVPLAFPKKIFCTDNGAMIAFTGLKYFLRGKRDGLNMPCSPQPLEKDFF